jgi:UDP-N-acetyl-D-glucosamine dehydrogenase
MRIGIVGSGDVGLPLALAFCEAEQKVVGVDSEVRVVEALGRGDSHLEDVRSSAATRGIEAPNLVRL